MDLLLKPKNRKNKHTDEEISTKEVFVPRKRPREETKEETKSTSTAHSSHTGVEGHKPEEGIFKCCDGCEAFESKFSCAEIMKTKTIILNGTNVEKTRTQIREYFHKTFDVYEKLFECLKNDSTYYLRPESLRHPLIFYYGHTATFFVNKLILAKTMTKRIDEKLESTCAVGVDEMSWDDLNDSHYEWPTPQQVKEYRNKVRATIDSIIQHAEFVLPITWDSVMWPIIMGIEHERIHLETSSVLIRQLPISEVVVHSSWPICTERSENYPTNSLLSVTEGHISCGKPYDHPLYGWDNEYSFHESDVAPFKASKYIVSNGEYLEFIKDDGYRTQNLWTEEGWKWRNYKKTEHPVFWVPVQNNNQTTYKYRTMLEEIDMPWDWPVDVNYLEAKAFCNWKSKKTGKNIRLPTEDEWYRLRDFVEFTDDQPYWDVAPGNINLEHYASSCPVNKFEMKGFSDVIGNVWQHTETPIQAFKGFRPHKLYDDFSIPTFDNRHNMIKGGSWIATGNEATRLSRYAFRRHFFQHAGFRYIESDTPVVIKNDSYEKDIDVCQIADLHFGDTTSKLNLPNFPQLVARTAIDYFKEQLQETKGEKKQERKIRALDMGCGVGRSSFELATEFDEVVGLDNSTRFILIASQLQEGETVRYRLPSEGELDTYHSIDLSDYKLLNETRGRCQFLQADGSNLDPKYSNYDLVLATNLLERLYAPSKFLSMIHSKINKGGVLVITSSYTWSEAVTPKSEWLGGFKQSAENVSSFDTIERLLSPHFKLINKPKDIPYVIRERERKFNYYTSQLSVWVRV